MHLVRQTAKIDAAFFSKNKKSEREIVNVKISFALIDSNRMRLKPHYLQGNKQSGDSNLPQFWL